MSERRVLGILLAAACLAGPARAQAPELEQLKRREAVLEARLDRLRAATADSAEQRFWGQARTVVSSGPLHVAFPEAAVAGHRDRLVAFLEARRRLYGDAVETLRDDTLYVGRVEEPRPDGTSWFRTQWRLGDLRGEQTDVAGWMEAAVATALENWSQRSLDPALRAWLGAYDSRSTVAGIRDPLVRDLVGSGSSRARRCLAGAANECRLLLELGAGANPVLEAYEPADLPALFGRMELNDRIPGKADCVGRRSAGACVELVRLGRVFPPHPVSARARQSLFAYAVAAGGEGAWLRLHRAAGRPVAEQLRLAAGRPVDSLVAGWQHDLLAGRRTATAGVVPSLILALAWGVVGLLLFAWRYRWRHV